MVPSAARSAFLTRREGLIVIRSSGARVESGSVSVVREKNALYPAAHLEIGSKEEDRR
jgi:hypothetical protein